MTGHQYLQLSYYVSQLISVIGTGNLQINILPFIIDQMIGASADDISAAVQWYCWTFSVRTLAYYLFLCVPINQLQKNNIEIFLALSFFSLSVVLITDCLFHKWLDVHFKRNNPFKTIFRVLNYARKTKYPEHRSALTYFDEEEPSRLDYGKHKFGGPFTEEEVEDVKTVLRLMPLFLSPFGAYVANNLIDVSTNHFQVWDLPNITFTQDLLLSNAPDDISWGRLMAVFAPEAGASLQALPISALGLRVEDETVIIAVALRLGLPICTPHVCRQCGVRVDILAHHGLSCNKNSGKHHRHATVNNVLYRAMASAGIPSTLEPSGLSRSDGKRPDELTSIPWAHGRSLVWDVTVPDSHAPSYRPVAVRKTGAVAARAESKKRVKISSSSSVISFLSCGY